MRRVGVGVGGGLSTTNHDDNNADCNNDKDDGSVPYIGHSAFSRAA